MKLLIGFLLLTLTLVAAARDPLDQGSDTCPGTVIAALPYSDTGTTAGLTDNAAGACYNAGGPDAIYTLTPTNDAAVIVSLCGSGFDTGLTVRTGGSCPGTTEVACNDDNGPSCTGTSSSLQFTATAGVTYWIVVDGYGTANGNYTLNLTLPASVNDCPGQIIAALPFTDAGNTCNDANDFSNCVGATSADTVYTYTATLTTSIRVSLCGSAYDTGLQVKTGGSCPGTTQIACNDDNGPACGGVASSIDFTATAGETYFFIVHGYATGCGDYVIDVSLPPLLGRCCYFGGSSCSDGLTEAECTSLYGGEFTPLETCASPCPCRPCSLLTIQAGVGPQVTLHWFAPSNGYDRIYSTTIANNDGNPDGGLDLQWSLRDQQVSSPGAHSWIEPDYTERYRNYVVVHYCP
ncbi:hypothetical protein HZB60_09840 [candidate division KSB1 bacterium]|nr:hypothetical protein [candidate division KSB1 bacterium]